MPGTQTLTSAYLTTAKMVLPAVSMLYTSPNSMKTISDIKQSFMLSIDCGVYDPKSPQFYELFIYADTGPASFWTKCVGVPVASNLVLASHRCFLKYGEKLYPYQLWENADGPRNSTAPIDTMVIRKNDFSRPFRVKTLIFNPIYVITARYNEVLPEEDVVIVVSETNLFDKGFNSLCLPTYNDDKPLDVFYQEGHYIGIGGILKIEGR